MLIVLAAGHTIGFLRFRPETPEGRAVFASMNSVHFQVGTGGFNYGGFYLGFGLFATLYLLFSAYVAWHLGMLANTNPSAIGALGWVFCVVQIVSVVLSWKYFLRPPVFAPDLVAICLVWATWLVKGESRASGLST